MRVRDDGTVRVDKWLWAARFFKTRALAAQAIDSGKVAVNGERVKRARAVAVGDVVRVRLGPYEHEVTVLAVSPVRGPATTARTLYAESAASVAAREALRAQMLQLAPVFRGDAGKPSKKDRRALARFRGRG